MDINIDRERTGIFMTHLSLQQKHWLTDWETRNRLEILLRIHRNAIQSHLYIGKMSK